MILHWSASDHFGDGFVEFFNVQLAVIVVMIELDNRRDVAHAQTAVHNLHGKLAVGCRLTAGNSVTVPQLVDQMLAPADETGGAMAEQHEVVARLFRSKVGIEGQQPIDTIFADSEVLRDDPRSPKWHPSQQMLHVLKRAKDELLGLFVVLWLKIIPE